MKVETLKLHRVSVPRRYETVIAQEGGKPRRAVSDSRFLFLEVNTDTGLTGWGEISDIVPEEMPSDLADYEAGLAAFVTGRNPFEIQQLHHDLREHLDLANNELARTSACALDMALYDLQGKATGRPVHDLLGGAVRKEVEISWVAYIRADLDLLREEISERVSEGFRAFKLKVGVDIDLDEERLAVLREVAGNDASLKIDANGGWSVAEAPGYIRRLNKYRLAGVETPIPHNIPAELAAVRREAAGVPILEHVSDPDFALALITAGAVDVFNVATTGAGGLWPARQIVALADAAKIGVLLGSTVELGPGTLAQLHLAATVPNLSLPSDLIGPGMYRDDVLASPLAYRDGKLDVPRGPGLGGEIDRDKLRKLAV